MIPYNLSHDMCRSTSYFIISVRNSFLIESRLTTFLISVARASLIILQLSLSLEVMSWVTSWLTINDPSFTSTYLYMGHEVKGVMEVGM
ncbi:BgTH12-03772 [Blumeria graminis f. sp. triticale]|uniref:Bgt-50703 n=2 Tax=Blumeria graminis TaxID=34373 RepID=A0A9X9L9L2_BLUGR|nr:BgTH12-03772 [Blumeria graminis f. sp. triticale]VCU39830.1 Bgt-50703 [Blumeria graminis f. sp. tritici]